MIPFDAAVGIVNPPDSFCYFYMIAEYRYVFNHKSINLHSGYPGTGKKGFSSPCPWIFLGKSEGLLCINEATVGKGLHRCNFIINHEDGAAFDISAEDCSKFKFKTFFCHISTPFLRFQTEGLKIRIIQRNAQSDKIQDLIQ
jgi:hypothetical protein